jgi:hypothetical protein
MISGLGKINRVKLFKYNIFYMWRNGDRGWFRLFGYGLSWGTKLKFSQQYGHKKYFKFGKYIIEIIK